MDKRETMAPGTKGCGGFSIVELMVALTLSLLLMAGVVSIVISSNRSYEALHQTSQQLENGRFAMQLLTEEIRHAGFYGEFSVLPDPPATPPSFCTATPTGLVDGLGVPIQVVTAPTGNVVDTYGSTCIPDANHVDGTDVLVIRRASTRVADPNALNPNAFYLQSTAFHGPANAGRQFLLDQGSNAENLDLVQWNGTAAEIRRHVVHVYFISPCSRPSSGSVCDANADGGAPIPTLKRLELTGNTVQIVPLVEGIEELRVEFGIDRSGDGAPNAEGVNDAYVTLPDHPEDAQRIVTARIHLLARNLQPTPNYRNRTVYDMGLAGTLGPFDDRFQRRLFTQTVRAVNLSSRREL